MSDDILQLGMDRIVSGSPWKAVVVFCKGKDTRLVFTVTNESLKRLKVAQIQAYCAAPSKR